MRRSRLRWLAALLALGLVAAACGDDRDDAAPTTTAGGAGTTAPAPDDGGDDTGTDTTEPADDGETFGDLAWPCGPAEDGLELGDSDVGVTADTIKIASGDDAGFAGAPGLNKEITDAMRAMVDTCNELGGINGRQIELSYYDAAITNVVNAMTQACQDGNFMVVGQGWSLDSVQEEVRLGCELASVPTYSVSAAFAHAPLMAQAVPNPADRLPASIAAHLSALYPDIIADSATMYGNYAATIESTDKVVEVYPEYGFEFVAELEYSIGGEDDWTPFVLQLRNAGAQFLYFSGSCIPNFQAFMQTAAVNGVELVTQSDANFYEDKCADANTDGAMDDLHVRMAFIPFEERDQVKAVDDFLTIVEGAGGSPSLLGMQGTSSFLLWATAADACGAELTRACVIEEIKAIGEWDGGGMHAPTNPGANEPPACGLVLKLVGTEYVRVYPEEPGTFDCDPSFVKEVSSQWVDQAQLDENRISQLFAAALPG
jgi:ABC-type branched-subunit amino acid transport system substrate-binding protein